MTHESVRENVNNFMNSLLEEGLLEITRVDERTNSILKNFFKQHYLGSSVLKKIIVAKGNNSLNLTDDEFSAFIFRFELATISKMFELNKIILKSILKIPIREKATYGEVLSACFDRLGYDRIRPVMRDIFLLDLRNTISHLGYEINGNDFTYRDSTGNVVTFDFGRLLDMESEYLVTTETIVNFLENNIS